MNNIDQVFEDILMDKNPPLKHLKKTKLLSKELSKALYEHGTSIDEINAVFYSILEEAGVGTRKAYVVAPLLYA